MLDMVAAIFDHRTFCVRDGGQSSKAHFQRAGIAQGCPLSPYLFVIVMSVIMRDALNKRGGANEKPYIVNSDVVCADDTTFFGSCAASVQRYFDCIADTGKAYGL